MDCIRRFCCERTVPFGVEGYVSKACGAHSIGLDDEIDDLVVAFDVLAEELLTAASHVLCGVGHF